MSRMTWLEEPNVIAVEDQEGDTYEDLTNLNNDDED
jgi:hypothetical protein